MAAEYKVRNNATKQEEGAYLDKIAGSVEEQTYLAQLFSRDMVAWCQDQIRNDCSCDLFRDMAAYRDEAQAAKDLVGQTQKIHNELANKLHAVEADNIRCNDALKNAYARIAELEAQVKSDEKVKDFLSDENSRLAGSIEQLVPVNFAMNRVKTMMLAAFEHDDIIGPLDLRNAILGKV